MVKDYFGWIVPIDKNLCRFLKDRHLLLSFHLNLFLYSRSFYEYNDIRYKLKNIDNNSISTSLDFNRTMEGYFYWEEVDRKWRIYYDFLNINTYENKI